jgi:hypothetical protein
VTLQAPYPGLSVAAAVGLAQQQPQQAALLHLDHRLQSGLRGTAARESLAVMIKLPVGSAAAVAVVAAAVAAVEGPVHAAAVLTMMQPAPNMHLLCPLALLVALQLAAAPAVLVLVLAPEQQQQQQLLAPAGSLDCVYSPRQQQQQQPATVLGLVGAAAAAAARGYRRVRSSHRAHQPLGSLRAHQAGKFAV